MFGEFINVSRV